MMMKGAFTASFSKKAEKASEEQRARTELAQENIESLVLLLQAKSLSEQKLHEELRRREEEHKLEIDLLKSEAEQREFELHDQIAQSEIQISRLRSELKLKKVECENQEKLENSSSSLAQRMAFKEELLKNELDRAHDDKQRHIKFLQEQVARKMEELELAQATMHRDEAKEFSLEHMRRGKSSKDVSLGGDGAKKFSASWLMEQLIQAKDELKEAKTNIKLLEETLNSQAGRTNELRMKLEQMTTEKASLMEQIKSFSSSRSQTPWHLHGDEAAVDAQGISASKRSESAGRRRGSHLPNSVGVVRPKSSGKRAPRIEDSKEETEMLSSLIADLEEEDGAMGQVEVREDEALWQQA
eukprot:768632-Hanusia_phi.AAC.3